MTRPKIQGFPRSYLARTLQESDQWRREFIRNQRTRHDLEGHPKLGASWEGFVLEQIINHLQPQPEECYFWSTYAGAELDLLIVRGRRRIGFEVKRTVSPKITPSMQQTLNDLKLQRSVERLLTDLPALS